MRSTPPFWAALHTFRAASTFVAKRSGQLAVTSNTGAADEVPKRPGQPLDDAQTHARARAPGRQEFGATAAPVVEQEGRPMPAPGARLGSGVHGEKPKWVPSIDLPLTVSSADDEVAPMNGFGVPKERFGER